MIIIRTYKLEKSLIKRIRFEFILTQLEVKSGKFKNRCFLYDLYDQQEREDKFLLEFIKTSRAILRHQREDR